MRDSRAEKSAHTLIRPKRPHSCVQAVKHTCSCQRYVIVPSERALGDNMTSKPEADRHMCKHNIYIYYICVYVTGLSYNPYKLAIASWGSRGQLAAVLERAPNFVLQEATFKRELLKIAHLWAGPYAKNYILGGSVGPPNC